jgi:hypothetical protein
MKKTILIISIFAIIGMLASLIALVTTPKVELPLVSFNLFAILGTATLYLEKPTKKVW